MIYPNLEIQFNRRDIIGRELDIFFPTLNLAVEISGIFHYKPIFGEDKLSKIQNSDALKVKLCKEHGIHLIVLDISEIKSFSPILMTPHLNTILEHIT